MNAVQIADNCRNADVNGALSPLYGKHARKFSEKSATFLNTAKRPLYEVHKSTDQPSFKKRQ